MFHTAAWLVWLVCAMVMGLTTSNPLYLALILAAVWVNFSILARRSEVAAMWQPLIRFMAFLVILSALLNPLLVHEGETMLFQLPEWKMLVGPDQRIALFTLGGPVTAEALAYGLTKGLGLLCIILTFATFNVSVDSSQLLRSLPRFMYQTGIVTSIAVSFVPQTVLALREIREAQMVRGHRFRGIRDLLPLFLPLLTTGFERALQLAESMEARGFGSRRQISPRQETQYKGGVALALVLLIAGIGWMGFGLHSRWWGCGLVTAAVLLLLAVFRAMGRQVQRSRYVRELWRQRDTVLVVATGTALVMFLLVSRVAQNSVHYYPYPSLRWPGFHPAASLAILLLVCPVVLAGKHGPRAKLGGGSGRGGDSP